MLRVMAATYCRLTGKHGCLPASFAHTAAAASRSLRPTNCTLNFLTFGTAVTRGVSPCKAGKSLLALAVNAFPSAMELTAANCTAHLPFTVLASTLTSVLTGCFSATFTTGFSTDFAATGFSSTLGATGTTVTGFGSAILATTGLTATTGFGATTCGTTTGFCSGNELDVVSTSIPTASTAATLSETSVTTAPVTLADGLGVATAGMPSPVSPSTVLLLSSRSKTNLSRLGICMPPGWSGRRFNGSLGGVISGGST